MKRLNKKGFTLVELLAVIIILAIVVGITIPAVLTTVDQARKKAGEDAAAIMADWIDKQYGLVTIGFGGADSIFNTVCGNTGTDCTNKTIKTGDTGFDTFVTTAGLKTSDVDQVAISINTTSGRSCVGIRATSGGSYYINKDDNNIRQGGTCTGITYKADASGNITK